MDDLSGLLQEFDAYLDGLLVDKKELSIDVKSVSKINKLSRVLASQSIISPHTEMNRNQFVAESWGRSRSPSSRESQDLPKIHQRMTEEQLLGVAKTAFKDLTVDSGLLRRLCLRRTKSSQCCIT